MTRYLNDGDLPIDNNLVENRIRPIALGRQNLLFAGSLRAGKRAAAVMSLIHAAKLNGLNPYAYLRDVLERLPVIAQDLDNALTPILRTMLTELMEELRDLDERIKVFDRHIDAIFQTSEACQR